MRDDLKRIYQLIERNIDIIEDRLNAIALFGAVGGSWSFNLANESSDIDFCLVVEWENI